MMIENLSLSNVSSLADIARLFSTTWFIIDM